MCIREAWIVNALIRDVTNIIGLSTRVHALCAAGGGDDKKKTQGR